MKKLIDSMIEHIRLIDKPHVPALRQDDQF